MKHRSHRISTNVTIHEPEALLAAAEKTLSVIRDDLRSGHGLLVRRAGARRWTKFLRRAASAANLMRSRTRRGGMNQRISDP